MRSQRLKDLYFTALAPVSYASHSVWRLRLRRRLPARFRRGAGEQVWLQLGSGAKAHPAFVNIDGNFLSAPDMWLDLRHGLPLPAGSVDAIYACHVFEHLYWRELAGLLRACARVLRPRGGLRALVPSVELAVAAYLRGDRGWFPDFPSRFSSAGGRLVNFLFCDGQHRLAFDAAFAAEALEGAGFAAVRRLAPRRSDLFPSEVLEALEPPVGHIETSLVVEARTPG
jgi:prepilin-type processing-associated H-X9-DG protein